MRPKVLQEYPGIKFVELGKVLGERWSALTPDDKKKYQDMAAEDKVRFQMEMQQYTANQAVAAPPPQAAAAPPPQAQYFPQVAQLPSGYEAYASQMNQYGQTQYP